MSHTTRPNDALAEILRQSGELDRILSGRGLTFTPAQGPPPPSPPPPLHIPPFDSSSFVEPVPVREPDPTLHREDTESLPAKPRPRTTKTPRLDQWRAEQMRPA